MQDPIPAIALENLNREASASLPFSQDACMTCGYCASACPVSGVDGFDPRKLVRMVNLGLDQEVVDARWPWICTMCGLCEVDCPMDVNISGLVRDVRGRRERDLVPGILQKGLEAALDTGNNLRLPREDFVFILEDVAEELAQEPGFSDFQVPIDKEDANLLVTVHNKLVNSHTDDLVHWWKLFHAAGEDWTIPSGNWEGCNWGMFTGDDEAVRRMTGRVVEHMDRLRARNLLWPE
ncbi:MAG: (Fe-S)-binding protein [Desulfobacteraceae bacterium]|jgi:heterodisulfide reductase subunit C